MERGEFLESQNLGKCNWGQGEKVAQQKKKGTWMWKTSKGRDKKDNGFPPVAKGPRLQLGGGK